MREVRNMTNTKEIERIERRLDRLEDRLERTEIRLEQINLSEIIAKGREILNIYDRLTTQGIIDVYNFADDILEIKKRLNKIEYHPWEWLERDPRAKQAFLAVLNRRIAEEVRQAGLFTLYEEQPSIVVKIVKDSVKEYLNIWEVNDQIAQQLVNNALKTYINDITKNVLSVVMSREYINRLKQNLIDRDKIGKAKKVLEEEW